MTYPGGNTIFTARFAQEAKKTGMYKFETFAKRSLRKKGMLNHSLCFRDKYFLRSGLFRQGRDGKPFQFLSATTCSLR